jgi:chromate transporter
VGAFFHLQEIYLMFGAGITALLINYFKTKSNSLASFFPISFFPLIASTLVSVSNGKLFFVFLKIGAVLYGSGYVLFAFLDTELVATGLLSRQQLIDAIAVGQFTPGPVFSSVTFVGYQITGFSGAVVSTIAIFLPSFLFVAFLNPLVKILRNSMLFSSFLDAVNVASVAVIAVICFEMSKESISDWRTFLITVLSLFITFSFKKINSAFVVLGGSLVGFLLTLI